jgi:hypothetical protein
MSDSVPFKWFTGAAPSIAWDCAFMAPADLLDSPEKYDRIPCRALGKLEINKDKQLVLSKNFPGMFGAQDYNSPGMVDRKLFAWIFEATPAAAADWEKTWTDPTEPSTILTGTEDQAEILAAQARQKAQLAKALKRGPSGLVN